MLKVVKTDSDIPVRKLEYNLGILEALERTYRGP